MSFPHTTGELNAGAGAALVTLRRNGRCGLRSRRFALLRSHTNSRWSSQHDPAKKNPVRITATKTAAPRQYSTAAIYLSRVECSRGDIHSRLHAAECRLPSYLRLCRHRCSAASMSYCPKGRAAHAIVDLLLVPQLMVRLTASTRRRSRFPVEVPVGEAECFSNIYRGEGDPAFGFPLPLNFLCRRFRWGNRLFAITGTMKNLFHRYRTHLLFFSRRTLLCSLSSCPRKLAFMTEI